MIATQKIKEAFESAMNADKSFMKSFMASWDYQVKRKKLKIRYEEELPQDFFRFSDPDEILKWMNWFTGEYPSYFDEKEIKPLIDKSLEADKNILSALGIQHDFDNYHNVGLNNAHDFYIPQSYPVPKELEVKTVMDFGAGYGRQANLWWPYLKGKGNFIGVDAIPLSYSLQSHYYSALEPDYNEYIFRKETFKIDPTGSALYHLPTWRLDLIPDNSVDLIICIQVLPELSRSLIRYLFKEFNRILKPGGAFYIRDLNFMYKASGTNDIDAMLKNYGFTLEFRAFIEHNKHLHGIPRIWRKDVGQYSHDKISTSGRTRKMVIESADLLSGGALRRWKQKNKKQT